MKIFRNSLSLILWAWCALLIVVPVKADAQGPYELVRGGQLPMCRELAKNLNEFRNEPPMVCARKFHPKYTDFTVPQWTTLNGDDAIQAALALERALAHNGRPKERADSFFAKLTERLQKAAAAGQLRVWESRFDIATNGEQVRVVMVSNGECEVADNNSFNDPIVGVLLPDKFEVDPRYRNLSHASGDVFFYAGTPYISTWREYPSATLNDRAGPSRRHRGYLLVDSTFWLPTSNAPNRGSGEAGVYDVVCQIGYERLSPARKGEKK